MNYNLPPTSQEITDQADADSRTAFAKQYGLQETVDVNHRLPAGASLVGDVLPADAVSDIEQYEIDERNSVVDAPSWKLETVQGSSDKQLPERLFANKDQGVIKAIERGAHNLADQPAPAPITNVEDRKPASEEQQVA